MIRVCVLALCLAYASAQQCDCTNGGSTVDKLKKALGEKGGLMAKWGADCKKENAETDDWLQTIGANSAANEADRKAREADKGKLAEALETRVAGLKVFIGQLQDILNKLGFHIERTNKLFGTKYDANLNDQTAASLALHDLSLDFAAPHNIKLNPIQQVRDWSPSGSTKEEAPSPAAEDTAKGVPADEVKTEAAMMFLETTVRTAMHQCRGTGCQSAYQKSFALYKMGYHNNVANKKNFESERDTIGKFRKKTREMLEKKKAKLAALNAQLTALKAAMASPDGNLADLFPLVKQHATVFSDSCKAFSEASAAGKTDLQALLSAIERKAAAAAAEDAQESPETGHADSAPAAGSEGAAAAEASAAPVEPAAVAAGSEASAAPVKPEVKPAKAAVAKPADEDLTKILNAPAPTKPAAAPAAAAK